MCVCVCVVYVDTFSTLFPPTLSASIESNMERLSEAEMDPGEWVLCVPSSGLIVPGQDWSFLTRGEALAWSSRPVLFKALRSDSLEPWRTEGWNLSSLVLSSEQSSRRRTSGELRDPLRDTPSWNPMGVTSGGGR